MTYCCGCFTPTLNPEPTCLRRFSNEHTAPAGPVYMKLAPFIEHSSFCIACGKAGCIAADRRRTLLAVIASVVTVLAWALTIYSCVGVSNNSRWIKTAHWSKGHSENGVFKTALQRQKADGHLVGGVDVHFKDLDIFAGPSGRLVVVACEREMHFRSECESPLTKLGFAHVGPGKYELLTTWADAEGSDACEDEECQVCRRSALPSVCLIIVSVMTGWPMLLADLQRSTRFGDLNCQAATGVFIALTSILSGLASLLTFGSFCSNAMPATIYGMAAEWHLGPGVLAMFIACFLKFGDMLFHLLLPTPSERWQQPSGPAAEDIAEYMKAASPQAPRTYSPLAPVARGS